jgi:hypothetical protein
MSQRRQRSASRKPRPVRDLARDPLVAFCRNLAAATEDIKWEDDLVFSVGGKMFAGFMIPDGTPFARAPRRWWPLLLPLSYLLPSGTFGGAVLLGVAIHVAVGVIALW